MGVEEEQGSARLGRGFAVQPGKQIVPTRRDGLTLAGQARPLELSLEPIGQPGLAELGAQPGAAHRVDAGNRDQMAKDFLGIDLHNFSGQVIENRRDLDDNKK